MNRFFLIILTVLLFISFNGNSQIIDVDGNAGIPEGAVRIDENAVFKDESGKIIDFAEFLKLMDSGKYRLDPVKDEKGKVQYFQLRKGTAEEKGMDGKKQDPMGSL